MLPGVVLFLPLLATAQPPDPAAQLAPFKRLLMAALTTALAEGAPAAVDACRLQAPAIAAAQATPTLRVGRTSHRLRNPENTAPAWVQPVLARYVAQPAAAVPVSLPLEGGGLGYVEPIRLMPVCVQCHGSELESSLAARIRARYPDDQATGFAVGDLRGVFWLEQRD